MRALDKDMTRRDFVRGAGMGAAGVIAAGGVLGGLGSRLSARNARAATTVSIWTDADAVYLVAPSPDRAFLVQ